jgi:hypothetical protein
MAFDATKVRVTNRDGIVINPATEDTLESIAGFNIPAFDYIEATYPTTSQEVYTYKTGGLSGTVVGTITINYTDATKTVLSSVAKT